MNTSVNIGTRTAAATTPPLLVTIGLIPSKAQVALLYHSKWTEHTSSYKQNILTNKIIIFVNKLQQ